jgi:raffinose/stachyose/melibiose transport system substrate-binding protein
VLDEKDSSVLFQSCSFNPISIHHRYEAFPWVSDASAYVAAGRSYQDLVLPSAVTDEQGRLLQEYYVGTVSQDEIIQQLDKAFKTANSLR